MKHFNFWYKWVLVSGYVIVAMALMVDAIAFFKIEMPYINSVFWDNGIPEDTQGFYTFILGLYCSVLLVFGLFVIFIARNAFAEKKTWAWNALATCYIAWYIADTFYSLYSGVYSNAVSNTVLFILIMLPLLATRKEF
jgi:hypothetical protein